MQQLLPWIVASMAALLVVWGLWVLRRRARRRRRRAEDLPSHWALTSRPIFSRDERKMYRQLREALPQHVILAKLPLVRLCQPTDPGKVRYWYNLLGATHVTFAICSTHGRVLAAVDLDGTGRPPSKRTRRIKQSVLAACRVRYLHCRIEHLPSLPELRALVPDGPATAAAAPDLGWTSEAAPLLWLPTEPAAAPPQADLLDDDDDRFPPGGAVVIDHRPPPLH